MSSEPRSLTATKSMSAPRCFAARKKLRPIRPKPLIPTRTVMSRDVPFNEWPTNRLNGVSFTQVKRSPEESRRSPYRRHPDDRKGPHRNIDGGTLVLLGTVSRLGDVAV